MTPGSGSPQPRRWMQSMRFDAASGTVVQARRIPVPVVPTRPVLAAAPKPAQRPRGKAPSVLDAGRPVWLTAGRVAIALALKRSGIGPGDSVLLPAFHCVSMTDAVVAVGARPVFYRLHDTLRADLDDLAAKADHDVRALLAVNTFGFPQDWRALRAFCRERGLTLIEDCAHAFFGSHEGQPLGSFGDYACASLTKFFPVWDGGLLIERNDGQPPAPLTGQNTEGEIRGFLHPIQEAVEYGRQGWCRPGLAMMDGTRGMLKRLRGRPARSEGLPTNPAADRSGAPGNFSEDWLSLRCSAASRLMVRMADGVAIAAARRANYRRLRDALDGLPGVRPLHPDLPDGVVPYMFPLVVDDLYDLFPHLEDRAVPMQRFGQFLDAAVDRTVCPVSHDLSARCLQLPCHQSLLPSEMDWICQQLREVVLAHGRHGVAVSRPVLTPDRAESP